MSKPRKPKVIFLGAFKSAASDGTIGGQAFACLSLVESKLSEQVEWLLIDSTQQSQPPPGFLVRLYFAFLRAWKSCWYLLTRRVQATLIFTRYEFSSFLEKGLIAIAASIFGAKAIISIRSEVRSFRHDRWTTFFRKCVVWFCHSIVCQSQEAADELVARLNCPREKIEIIPNWIDANSYQVANRKPNDETMRFLFMGWLESYKGVQHLLDAADQLKRDGLDFEIDICGGGSETESLKQQADELNLSDRVRFLGWVSGKDKAEIMSASNVLVLPSYSEGMPNSVLESMAAGMAIIATPVGGTPSLVASQQQGYLVEVGQSEPIAEAMRALISDPQKTFQMGQHNVKFVLAHHDVESVWPKVASIFGIKSTA